MSPTVDDGFEKFLRCYPRRDKKQEAWKAWNQLYPNELLVQTILEAIERQNLQHVPAQSPAMSVFIGRLRGNSNKEANWSGELSEGR